MNVKGMLKENSLKGKTVLVTGGATGLGKSMATYFLDIFEDAEKDNIIFLALITQYDSDILTHVCLLRQSMFF